MDFLLKLEWGFLASSSGSIQPENGSKVFSLEIDLKVEVFWKSKAETFLEVWNS